MTDPDSVQKTVYADEDLAKWVEQTAQESERSESYVIHKILEMVKDLHDDKPADVNTLKLELANK